MTDQDLAKLDDWYTITRNNIIAHGGGGLLDRFGSVLKILKDVYPAHNWQEVTKPRLPNRYWNSISNRVAFVKQLEQKLSIQKVMKRILHKYDITSLEDWYTVPVRFVLDQGGRGWLDK
jgi:hypothetical protein